MVNASDKKKADLAALFEDIENEIDDESLSAMNPEDRALEGIAREILLLERDMTSSGSSTSEALRIERLAKFIEERDF